MSPGFLFKFSHMCLLAGIVSVVSCKGQGKPAPQQAISNTVAVASENSNKTFRISDYFNGFNTQMLRGPAWDAPGFVDRVKELHPGLIRYPGGTVASYWDWKTGWLKKDVPPRKAWKSITAENPLRLEDLKFACDQTGAKPLFVLNMMTSNLQYQMEMLEYAKKIGLPVLFVELDNEIYLGEDFYVKKFPSGKEYGEACNKWISAIKNQFPGVKVAVVGNSSRESAAKKEKAHAQRTQTWNHDVLATVKNADGMTFHVYGGGGMNFPGLESDGADDDGEPNSKAIEMQQKFDKKESIAFVLSAPFSRWNSSNSYDYKILPEGMKSWITEYNLFEREGVVAGTWAHGLYALMQTLLFMENQQTELICYHNLTTSAQFAAIFNTDEGFHKSVKKKPTSLYGFTAAGYCLSLSGKAMSEGGSATKLKFSSNQMQTASRGQQYPSLTGWKITGGKGNKIIVANLSENSVPADFSKVLSGTITYKQLHAEPHIQVAEEKDVNLKKGTGATMNLPPYSVTLIEGN